MRYILFKNFQFVQKNSIMATKHPLILQYAHSNSLQYTILSSANIHILTQVHALAISNQPIKSRIAWITLQPYCQICTFSNILSEDEMRQPLQCMAIEECFSHLNGFFEQPDPMDIM